MKARIKEISLDKYILEIIDTKEEITASIRGNTKKKNSILVGDLVEVEKSYDRYMIEKVLDRKNSLIRPPVANIDNLVIVVSLANPKPDFFLLDKQIVLCISKNITPIIVINKIDLNLTEKTKSDISYIREVYMKLGIKVIEVSSKEGIGIDTLKASLKNKISAFSGNSGVGKSSIINAIFEDKINKAIVSDVARKTNRGKHTTKHVRIYTDKDMYILDTPGFSSYELYDIEYKKLKEFYPEFEKHKCEYLDCNHVNESVDVCKVKEAVDKNLINKDRYGRYIELFSKLKEQDDKKYK